MRRLLTLLTVVAALSVVMATPASAGTSHRGHRPFGGEQVMVLNQNDDGSFGRYGCDGISWFGTIELYGKTYGMALYPISSYVEGDTLYYEEGWKIFTGKFKIKDGELKRCRPGRVLAAGVDEGVGSFVTGEFESYGTVDYASRPFRCWRNRTVYQQGVTQPISAFGLENVLGFYGSLQLN